MEQEFFEKIESLKTEIRNKGSQDIKKKAKLLFSLFPDARLSLVSSDFDLIGVSSILKRNINNFLSSEATRKCYKIFMGFDNPCAKCAASEALKINRPSFYRQILTPEHTDANKSTPRLNAIDILAIPCGLLKGNSFSHCLELIFITTMSEKKRIKSRYTTHRLKRILFERLQDPIAVHDMLRLLLFGCLYAAGERVTKCTLYRLPEDDPLHGNSVQTYTLSKTKETDNALKEIFNIESKFNVRQIISGIHFTFSTYDKPLATLGLTPEDLVKLEEGLIRHFSLCKKAAAFIIGIPKYKLPNFLLVIDKEGLEEFVSFEEMGFLSSYATFSRYTFINRRWHEESLSISSDYKRLMELAEGPSSDAFIGSLIVSATHTAAHNWRNTFPFVTDIIIDKLPKYMLKDVAIDRILKTYKAAKEALGEYFHRMDKWRAMSSIKLRDINAFETIQNVLERFEARFEQREIFIDQTNCDRNIEVQADNKYFEEVLDNLFQNAYDALEDTPSPRISISLKKLENNMARLCIEDNGVGFDENKKDIIWIPGYTTKNHGTGQGLPFVSYAVNKAFKGRTECYTARGRNKTGFVLYLPC